jgi:cytochrome P450
LTEFLGMSSYILYDLEMIEYVLIRNSKNYRKDTFVRSWEGLLGNGLVTASGPEWKTHRKMLQPAFRRERIEQYGVVMAARIQSTLESWRVGQTRPILNDMTELTLDVVTKVLFGSEFSKETQREFGLAFNACATYYETLLEPVGYLLRNLPLPRRRRYQDGVRRLNEIVLPLLNERRTAPERHDDLLSILIAARDENGEAMTDQQARDEAMTLFLAGHETSALVLTMTLFEIAQYPEIQSRLRREIHEATGGQTVKPADIPRLEFMSQVVNEAMRLYPPIWLMGRESLENDQIGPYRIKKGATVVVPIRSIHRMETFYAEPSRFMPDRWTAEFERSLPRAAFMPFGYGTRSCIGAGFALLEIQIALAMILQKFSLTLESEKEVDLQPAATSRPRREIMIRLHATTGVVPSEK